MSTDARRRNRILVLVVLLLLILLLLLRCGRAKDGMPTPTPAAPARVEEPAASAQGAPPVAESAEVLTPATLSAPARVLAGAELQVAWTGPDNRGDFVTVVAGTAPPEAHGSYAETKAGSPLALTAPIEAGAYELRYVTARSRTILGRLPLEVVAPEVTLDAPPEVLLGTEVSVTWSGPDNRGDYVTLVASGTPDDRYGNYTNTEQGSPLKVRAPTVVGEAELRYVSGAGRKVLARRPIRVLAAEVTLDAPAEALAGTTLALSWTGPDNPGDYLTVVSPGTPDGQYGNYVNTAGGSPAKLLLPIPPGAHELRYVAGQGNRVLARRALRIVAAEVTLSAPAEAPIGADVEIAWTGPNNPGDYLTVVAAATPDGQYGAYTNTTAGSPLKVKAPAAAGPAEVRYMTGQGNQVLARRPLTIVP
ncbi:MAG TPA: hypothetical protein VF530_21720 [Planctomycetota bacterium]